MPPSRMLPRTRAALRRMQTMAGQSGRLYRDRIRDALTALRDRGWIESQFDGQETAAVRYLQEQLFQDIGGFITLQKLLSIYRVLPASVWVRYHYNLRALELLHDRPEYSDPNNPSVSVKAYVRLTPGGRRETRRQEITRLRGELNRLERRRAKIVTRLQELGETV